MIRRRLNYLLFSVRLITLLLPLVAFGIAAYVRFTSGLIPLSEPDYDPADYFGLLLFTTLVWAILLEHYDVVRLDSLFLGRSSAGVAVGRVWWPMLRCL